MRGPSDAPPCNLTAEVRNWQIRLGVIVFALALAATVLVHQLGVVSPLRYLLFIPFLFAFQGIHLGLTGVCGMSALRGLRQTSDGPEPFADRNELRRVRQRGAAIVSSTVVSALAVTLTLLH
jgi:hypothetical protein